MVDVMKSLKLKYAFANTASAYRGLQESIVNYANNKDPEFITCLHEDSAAAMAHGYAKVANEPAMVCCHGTVGLQHASMGLYNAWCDRAPMIVIAGNTLDASQRVYGNEWTHAAQDPAAIVRDFTKWDDQPVSLQHFAESLVRSYRVAITPPMEPVLIVADAELQEMELRDRTGLTIPRLSPVVAPQGDAGAVLEAATLLANAEHPVIVVDRVARTSAGMQRLVEFAEALNAPVIDIGGRMNFPNQHHLCQSAARNGLIDNADVLIGMEVGDFYSTITTASDNVQHSERRRLKPGAKLITLGMADLYIRSNYQDFERYAAVDVSIAGDAEATLPALTEAVKMRLPAARRDALAARSDNFRMSHATAFERARNSITEDWDAVPVSTARVAAELYELIKNEDWALVSAGYGNCRTLWNFDKHYQYIGSRGGGGVGYGMSASVGATMAHQPFGRFCVNFQPDGDMMFSPGAIWTAAHHKVPLLTIMHNNRAYHTEVMHIQKMCNRWNRGVDRAAVGCAIANPNIDYAMMARSMGMHGEGPINDPKEVLPALKRAVAIVKRGEPALIDIISQPR
jgi:thiamine pyrophosphate-dependent acetolactate synthase large subunit-like protein